MGARIDLEPEVLKWVAFSDWPLKQYAVPRPVKFQMRGTRSRVLRRLVGGA